MAYVCEGDEPGHTTKHGFIDKKGRYVCELPPQCTAAGRFRNGLCPVRLKKGKGEEVLYVDRTGRVAVRPPAGYRFEVMFPGEP